MEGIQVSVEKVGSQSDISIIRVGGYIDTTTSSELERALDSLLKAGVYWIIIDLGNVDYISSAGWGIFISEIKGIRERGGDLKLARMIPDVYEVFELLEFHYILKAFDSIEAAVGDFEDGAGLLSSEDRPESEDFIVQELESTSEENVSKPAESAEEKLSAISKEHPDWSPSKIAKELNTEKYGFIRMSSFSVRRQLKKLGSGTKKDAEDAGVENSGASMD